MRKVYICAMLAPVVAALFLIANMFGPRWREVDALLWLALFFGIIFSGLSNGNKIALAVAEFSVLYLTFASVSANLANLNSVRYAIGFSGATAGAEISAAITDLGTSGGVVKVTFSGAQSIATDVFTGVTAPVTVDFPSASTYTLGTSVTIPSNISLHMGQQAMFAVPTGDTLTDNGSFEGDESQHFSVTSGGYVVLTGAKYDVRWFGAKGDDSTDDAGAINTTLTMVGNAHGGVVYAPNCPSAYKLGSSLSFPYTGGSGGSSGSILFQVACNLDLYAAQTWGSSGGGVTVQGLATASANGVSSLGQSGNYANLIHDFTGGPMITLNAGPIELKNLTMKNCVSGCITIAATAGSDFILRNVTAYEYSTDSGSPLTINDSIQVKVIDSFFEAETSGAAPSIEIKNTANQTIICDFVRDHFFYGGIKMDANFASPFSQFRFDSPLFEDLQLPAFTVNATSTSIADIEINNPANADCVSHGCSLLKTSHGGSNNVSKVTIINSVGSTSIIDSTSDMAGVAFMIFGKDPTTASNQTQPFYITTDDSRAYINGGGLAFYAPLIVGARTVTFSATPTFDAGGDTNAGNDFTITLTGNVTSSTITGYQAGQQVTFHICQDGVGSHTFAWPTSPAFAGAGTIGTTASKCNSQTFTYESGLSEFVATGPMQTNE